ncbi:MAG: glycosyl transferase group 1 [Thermoleophilia bacterium]|nr:glycosyl transferase group 1 [Thermoleophilia bacterium]
MRVAIVDPASWSLAYDEPLAASLARAGCEVTLYCTRSAHGVESPAEVPGLKVDEWFYRPGYGLGVLPRRLGRAIRHPLDLSKLVRHLRTNADVVLVQWMPGRRVDARAWAQLAKDVPVLFTAHNAQERDKATDAELLQGFSAVIAHSDGGAATLREVGLTNVWRMTIGAYDQYARMPDPATLPADIPADAPLAVFAGLLRDYKGVDVLLDAWPAVVDRVPDARLIIAGRPVDVELPAVAPAGATILPRFVSEEELGWLLRRAQVCVLPYRKIDMSGVAVSALACGTPLVASDVGGLGEYAGRGALLVPPGDATALAEALIEVLGSPERQEELAREAREAVAEHYSWDGIAAQYVERLTQLVSGAAGA